MDETVLGSLAESCLTMLLREWNSVAETLLYY